MRYTAYRREKLKGFNRRAQYDLEVQKCQAVKLLAGIAETICPRRIREGQTGSEDSSEVEIKAVVVSVTDKMYAMADKNDPAVNVSVFDVSDDHQKDCFVEIVLIVYPNNLVRGTSLSHLNSFCVSLSMNNFNYSCSLLSVILRSGVSARMWQHFWPVPLGNCRLGYSIWRTQFVTKVLSCWIAGKRYLMNLEMPQNSCLTL